MRIILCTMFLLLQAAVELAAGLSEGASKYPVEVTFLIADLKYSEIRGAQICEIQHGVPSTFKGETFSNGGISYIAQNLVNVLNRFFQKSWAEIAAFSDPSAQAELKKSEKWQNFSTFEKLRKDKEFNYHASLPVDDPFSLASYHGFVFKNPIKSDDRKYLRNKFPGVVFIDNCSHMYRRDKLMWSNLLLDDPILLKHKPVWKEYKKTYHHHLAALIVKDIPSEIFVIKPLAQSLGKGVIIVQKDDLDSTLQYILKKTRQKPHGYDSSYDAWFRDHSEYFIVEEFIESEPIKVPHLDGRLYSPTLRLAFLLIYDNQNVEVAYLGGYCSLPSKAVEEEGTLNERYKSCCKLPYYCKADPVIMHHAEEELREALTVIFRKLLGI